MDRLENKRENFFLILFDSTEEKIREKSSNLNAFFV